MDVILNLDWEALSDPALIGVLVSVCMGLLGKKLIFLLFTYLWNKANPGEEMPEELPVRALAVNVSTFLLCFAIASTRMQPFHLGGVFVQSLVATVVAISVHEATKNALGTVGVHL